MTQCKDIIITRLFCPNILNAYREEQRIQEEKQQKEEAEYQAMLEKEEREYKATLIKKYGKRNALLILENAVKIGFTKEMCVESWGEPYDINRTITRNCIHEQWVYGIGRYLYFEGNILTAIQEDPSIVESITNGRIKGTPEMSKMRRNKLMQTVGATDIINYVKELVFGQYNENVTDDMFE